MLLYDSLYLLFLYTIDVYDISVPSAYTTHENCFPRLRCAVRSISVTSMNDCNYGQIPKPLGFLSFTLPLGVTHGFYVA